MISGVFQFFNFIFFNYSEQIVKDQERPDELVDISLFYDWEERITDACPKVLFILNLPLIGIFFYSTVVNNCHMNTGTTVVWQWLLLLLP